MRVFRFSQRRQTQKRTGTPEGWCSGSFCLGFDSGSRIPFLLSYLTPLGRIGTLGNVCFRFFLAGRSTNLINVRSNAIAFRNSFTAQGPPGAELNVRLWGKDDELRGPHPVCEGSRVNSPQGDRPVPRNLLRPACPPPNPRISDNPAPAAWHRQTCQECPRSPCLRARQAE